jgi:NADPH-dependent curcumin reductase CurA
VTNRRIVLARRPEGAPTAENFRLEQVETPALRSGEVLLRTEWLSLDPYMRGRMSDAPSYAAPVEVGQVMVGQTISRVAASLNPAFERGEVVLAYSGWQEYGISDGSGLTKLGNMKQPSWALGVLGMPAFTAYIGLLEIGKPQPGETVLVGAATGAVGSMVGQFAKLKGCRAIGIAGGPEKCAWAVDGLGFDACLDHQSGRLSEALRTACPDGVDVYFENVGGDVLRAVVPLLNTKARIPLCGLIAQYSDTGAPEGPDRLPGFLRTILTKRITLGGFIIMDHFPRFPEFSAAMGEWVAAGKIVYREDVVEGLERAPEAFMGMLQGKNFGKLVVRV